LLGGLLQPCVPRERAMTGVLVAACQERGAVLLGRLVATVCATVDPRLGNLSECHGPRCAESRGPNARATTCWTGASCELDIRSIPRLERSGRVVDE
jgi:hypothetical protein